MKWIRILTAAAVLGLSYYWLNYEDVRILWRPLARFEKEFPGCVAGIISGDYASLELPTGFAHFYLAWGDNFPSAEIAKANRGGAILALTWEPYLKTGREQSLLAGIGRGEYDAYIKAMAASIKKYGRPVMLRWGHEPNGDWYSWSGAKNGNSPEEYKKAWRRMAGLMRTGAGSKLKLIFSVNGEDKPRAGWNKFENYYPGPDYADAVGLDAYNWGESRWWSAWIAPGRLLKSPYRRALAMAPDKPLFLTETAACREGGSKAQWLSKLLRRLETRYTAVKGFMWFDYNKECDWRLSSDSAAAGIYGRAAAAGFFKADGGRLNWFFGD
ncbi:MAG: hypothetical protein A2X28_07185 [Elusimicrobia bacterium GWA2_56_46]|nr:MAG: hypothetical protein A2X28_07185 [Elusimicrobia bacterium GWA2_56_46]OGR54771.1 MAG: hypothetical protein A2X39_10805 [Elusimicrobia bacterium GWC2_56_31]HBB67393.1 hypothetical protein [Elusimicrobiota bacterium]HBW23438.1 hypothetical protein [Elusimicrobiota bacterium]